MADVRLALTAEDLKNAKRDNQSAKAILSQKVCVPKGFETSCVASAVNTIGALRLLIFDTL